MQKKQKGQGLQVEGGALGALPSPLSLPGGRVKHKDRADRPCALAA